MIFYDVLCNHKVVDVALLRLYKHNIAISPFYSFTLSPFHNMDKPIDYIALSIPIFFLLIGLELLISRLKHTQLYRFNDAITNISCGIGQQVIGVFLKTFTVLGYVFIYQNYRLIPNMPQNALTWVLLFIGVDFFYYWFHRLAHEINVLWGSHVVHHQSEEYNLSVALRQSWVQSVFSSLFYLPLAYIGFSPVLFVTIAAFQTLYQFWIHTRIINKMPTWFEYVFNTPSHHRVHHGVNPIYIDRNHGGTLIIFDRMFGTFQTEQEAVVYGITVQPKSWNPLWLNLDYWVHLWNEFWQMQTWGNRWHLLFGNPGWHPANELVPQHEFNAANYHKYDTTISPQINYYILGQYTLILGGATVFLFSADAYSLVIRVLLAVLIIWAIVNCGALFENKTWATPAEIARLLGTALAVYFITAASLVSLLLVVLFAFGSIIWLLAVRKNYQTNNN